MITITDNQFDLANQFMGTSNFLEGPAGSGKSTIAAVFLQNLINQGVPGDEILILVPQRSLGLVYQNTLAQMKTFNHGQPTIQTMGGIAQRTIRLFWPYVLDVINFNNKIPPTFLTLETAQYYLAKVCVPFLEKGYFETVHADPPRIYSQILDNLNKAAVIGFDYLTIAERLRNAWSKEPEHVKAYLEAQEVAAAFRTYCLENNLLDFSLQFEIFANQLWPMDQCKKALNEKYNVLLFDNSEEDVPVTHQVVKEWLPNFESSLIIYDQDAGFRAFLGADPISAYALKPECEQHFLVEGSWTNSETIQKIIPLYSTALKHEPILVEDAETLNFIQFRHNMYYPRMVDMVTDQVAALIQQEHIPANEIAILAPFVSDALRFQIQNRLENKGISLISHRPSRSLREEPATHVMLTWAKIAHPDLKIKPNKYDVRTSLMFSIQGLDPLRADLMTQVLFSPNKEFVLNDLESTRVEMQNRFTFAAGAQYETIRLWLLEYIQHPADLDIFFARFFGEVLSQPGFGYHENYQAASIIANLIESVQKFRRVTTYTQADDPLLLTNEYLQMIENGTIAASYLETWQAPVEDAVYLAPAHTFLMQNRPVRIQFWLDIGSQGWWQRLLQPLTQPYVLSKNWQEGMKWTDIQEFKTNQENLARLVTGLLRRCEDQVFMYTAGFNERGEEEKGYLLQAVQRLLRYKHQLVEQDSHV